MIPQLLRFNGKDVEINPHLLSFDEIKALWDRDKSKDKSRARKELTLIWGILDETLANPWKGVPLEQRKAYIIKDLFNGKFDSNDEVFKAAYKKILSLNRELPEEKLIRAYEKLIDKYTKFLSSIDFNAVDKYGRPLYGAEVLKSIQEHKKAVDVLKDLRNKLAELANSEDVWGGGELGMFETEDNLDI